MFLHQQIRANPTELEDAVVGTATNNASFSTDTPSGTGYSLELGSHSNGAVSEADYAHWTIANPSSGNWAEGFTMECWVKVFNTTNYGPQDAVLLDFGYGNFPQFTVNPTDGVFPGDYFLVARQARGYGWYYIPGYDGNHALYYNNWYHFAVTYAPNGSDVISESSTVSLFLNGVDVTSRDDEYPLDKFERLHYLANPPYGYLDYPYVSWNDTEVGIGSLPTDPPTNRGLRGRVDEVRISRGIRYTGNFTPETKLTADSSTWFYAGLDNNYDVN